MREHQSRYTLGLIALAAALLAATLYWPSLRLPVIYDSLLHIRIAKGLNLFTAWLPTPKFAFFRPMTFLPMILIRGLFADFRW